MSRSRVLLGLPLVLLLVGCQKTAPVGTEPGEQSVPETVGETTEMGQAIGQGISTVCMVTGQDGSVATYQMKEGMMRADGMRTGKAGSTGSMINDGMYIYSWQSGETQGTKLLIPNESMPSEVTEKVLSQVPDTPDLTNNDEVANLQRQGLAVDCQGKDIDNSVFVPPKEVTFIDTTAMIPGLGFSRRTGTRRMVSYNSAEKCLCVQRTIDNDTQWRTANRRRNDRLRLVRLGTRLFWQADDWMDMISVRLPTQREPDKN